MGDVILGMPGPWADSNSEAADHYTTKIGGVPDWSFPIHSVKPGLIECDKCGKNFSLIAQVYAPIPSIRLVIGERVIYIFTCLTPNCDSNVWRAIRVQRICNGGEPVPPCNEMVNTPDPAVSASVPNNKWQDSLWSSDSREEHDDDESDDDDIDLEELGRALSEAANVASAGRGQSTEDTRKPLVTDQPYRPVEPVMPCFYVYTQEEKLLRKVTSDQPKDPSLFTDEPDGETYAAEKYEYDKAMDADRTYLKFMKRVNAHPEQCFRYSYGGTPLLASGEAGDPESCGLCGESRHYEMQLMAPMIYFLQEAADKHQRKSLEKFDWMSLLVYTCSQSCVGPSQSHEGKSSCEDWVVAEEAVIVQHEKHEHSHRFASFVKKKQKTVVNPGEEGQEI